MSDDVFVMKDPPARLEPQALAKLAVDVVEGRTYLANTDEGIKYSFQLMLMMTDLREVADSIGAIYAPMSAAMPRSINGYPMFMTMSLLHRNDVAPLFEKIGEYKAQREGFLS